MQGGPFVRTVVDGVEQRLEPVNQIDRAVRFGTERYRPGHLDKAPQLDRVGSVGPQRRAHARRGERRQSPGSRQQPPPRGAASGNSTREPVGGSAQSKRGHARAARGVPGGASVTPRLVLLPQRGVQVSSCEMRFTKLDRIRFGHLPNGLLRRHCRTGRVSPEPQNH